MKAKELIELLQKCNPSAFVTITLGNMVHYPIDVMQVGENSAYIISETGAEMRAKSLNQKGTDQQ